ncbi:MAG: ankyrin repeat domain-containing protein, partial [Oscillospiraceae bacterium]|nr:ankyrin repeat domain-containing protein [Oscillospiraceae bacterium]
MQLTLLTHLDAVRVLFYIGIAYIAVPIIFFLMKALKKIRPKKKALRLAGLILGVGIVLEIPSLYYLYLNGEYNISEYNNSDILYIAADSGDMSAIKRMLKKGGDPSQVTRFGNTAFYCAADRGDSGAVSLMLEYGADVNKTGNQYTPLAAACKNGDSVMAYELLKAGADPDYMPGKYPSALSCAAAFDEGYNFELINMLCGAGANRSAVTVDSTGKRWLPFKYYFHKAWQTELTPEEQSDYDKIAALLERSYRDWVMENADFLKNQQAKG